MAHKKIPTRSNDSKGTPIFEGDTIMTGSPTQFITVEWVEIPADDDVFGKGKMVGFFIPDDAVLLVDNKHPGFEKPSNS